MNLFSFEVITPPTHLPITVSAAQKPLALAVVDECERAFLWRAIVAQERRITVDGPLPPRLEMSPRRASWASHGGRLTMPRLWWTRAATTA